MSILTPNIGLSKPDPDQRGLWGDDIASSFDTIDVVIGQLQDGVSASGKATAGTATTLTDTSLNMDINAMAGGSLVIIRNGIVIRLVDVISNTVDTFTFATGNTVAVGDSYSASPDTLLSISNLDNKTHSFLQKSVAGSADVTLTSPENLTSFYELTGVITANINVIVDVSPRHFTVLNNTTGSFTITIKTSAGSGIIVNQGKSLNLYCDGTNVVDTDTQRAKYDGALASLADLTQVFTDSIPTIVQFAAEDHDTSGIHDIAVNNTRMTVPSDISYVRLTGQCQFNWATASGTIRLSIIKNGAFFVGMPLSLETNTAGGKDSENIVTPVLSVVAGDYFELRVTQYSGANKSLQDLNTTWLSMECVE